MRAEGSMSLSFCNQNDQSTIFQGHHLSAHWLTSDWKLSRNGIKLFPLLSAFGAPIIIIGSLFVMFKWDLCSMP